MKNFIIIGVLFLFIFIGYNTINCENDTMQKKNLKIDDIKKNITAHLIQKHENDNLKELVTQLHVATDEELKKSWKNEYGCKLEGKCPYFMMNASSYEEALWMKRRGYLSRTVIDKLKNISHEDLINLERNGNLNAKKLLAISALRSKNSKLAKSYARSARAYENASDTFSLRLMAQAYLVDNQPMLATVELRMASLLGDVDATKEYERLTRNSAREFLDNTNLLAFRYLSSRLALPPNEWDSDPRPNGG
jgi:hypothetical protein